VDNLADAENLTRIEHEQERVRKEKKKRKLLRKKQSSAVESHNSLPEPNGNTLVEKYSLLLTLICGQNYGTIPLVQ
jgi:hypothetical protein